MKKEEIERHIACLDEMIRQAELDSEKVVLGGLEYLRKEKQKLEFKLNNITKGITDEQTNNSPEPSNNS